jgi:hypothetical protein
MISENRPCHKGNRCRRWRVCPDCARIRQAQIADVAQRLSAIYPALDWTILHPVRQGSAAVATARAAWARASAAPAGIWTVEQSPETKNLHINIIHPRGFAAATPQAHVWREPLRGDVRRVAAYISKPEQYPDRLDHPGRTYGTLGPLWAHLANPRQAETVAAAAIEQALNPGRGAAAAPPCPRRQDQPAELSAEEYRRIAATHLPNMLRPRVRI